MRKPTVTLRKPPAAADAFVALDDAPGATAVPTPDVKRQTSPKPRASSGGAQAKAPPVRWRRTVTTRADGSQAKRLTIYLPEALARRLAVQAEAEGRAMSDVIAAALESAIP